MRNCKNRDRADSLPDEDENLHRCLYLIICWVILTIIFAKLHHPHVWPLSWASCRILVFAVCCSMQNNLADNLVSSRRLWTRWGCSQRHLSWPCIILRAARPVCPVSGWKGSPTCLGPPPSSQLRGQLRDQPQVCRDVLWPRRPALGLPEQLRQISSFYFKWA